MALCFFDFGYSNMYPTEPLGTDQTKMANEMCLVTLETANQSRIATMRSITFVPVGPVTKSALACSR